MSRIDDHNSDINPIADRPFGNCPNEELLADQSPLKTGDGGKLPEVSDTTSEPVTYQIHFHWKRAIRRQAPLISGTHECTNWNAKPFNREDVRTQLRLFSEVGTDRLHDIEWAVVP